MVESTGPYVVPMNFAYTPGRLFFHAGPGRKTAALEANPRVCVAVAADEAFDQGTSPCTDGFSFRGVILEGWAALLENPDEREKALRAIVAKYDPDAAAGPFDEEVLARTLVYAVIVETLSYRELPQRAAE
jgi:nitroimidazol reductase NimA-like FMN-containing flavoprotein (pyridoxamine 5'-phosphate oxidase superfamily)